MFRDARSAVAAALRARTDRTGKVMETISAPSASEAAPAPVKDATTASFAADVIDASVAAPVVVDFWAPWCGPCKQLGPALEKAVTRTKGAVRLVKVNIDDNRDIAAQLRIQSIPAVFAFFQGRPVDGFVGALPESQVTAFVERLVKLAGAQPPGESAADVLAAADAALAAGDAEAAGALYGRINESDPANAAALAGLARCALAGGDTAAARAVLDGAPGDLADSPEIKAARTALELAEQAADPGAEAALQARLERDADDHQARFDLALALYAQGQPEAAIDQLMELVRRSRAWNDEAARKQLVKIFEALGQTHPLTVSGRRRLSSLLFA